MISALCTYKPQKIGMFVIFDAHICPIKEWYDFHGFAFLLWWFISALCKLLTDLGSEGTQRNSRRLMTKGTSCDVEWEERLFTSSSLHRMNAGPTFGNVTEETANMTHLMFHERYTSRICNQTLGCTLLNVRPSSCRSVLKPISVRFQEDTEIASEDFYEKLRWVSQWKQTLGGSCLWVTGEMSS